MSIFKKNDEKEVKEDVRSDIESMDTSNYNIDDIRNFIDKLEAETATIQSEIRALATIILRFAPGDKDIRKELNRISSININVRPW